jgi:RNA polymerase sigma factor (sigma-70 family)
MERSVSAEEAQHSSNPSLDRRRLLSDLLVRETPHLRKNIAARIWRADLARDPASVADLTEEVLQEVAVRAWARADKYDPTSRGHAWLDLIALNVLHEQRRRIYDERKSSIPLDPSPASASYNHDRDLLEQLTDNRAFDDVNIQELLELVPPDDREILHTRYVLGLTPEEIAAKHDLSLGAVYMRLSRSRGKLREAFSKLNEVREE